MPEKLDVQTIEDVLALRAEKLKWDKEAIAAFPHLRERLSQYVKNRGPKWRWCLNCYITKKPDSRLEPWLPVGPNEEQRALYKCGKCGRRYEAHR